MTRIQVGCCYCCYCYRNLCVEKADKDVSPALPDIKLKAKLATDLRDEFEQWVQAGQYAPFMTRLVPILLKQLDGPPSLITTSPEQV